MKAQELKYKDFHTSSRYQVYQGKLLESFQDDAKYEHAGQDTRSDLGLPTVGDLATIDIAISDDDQALFLLTSLPSSYGNFVETLLYCRDTLKLEDVLATLISKHLKRGCPRYNQKKSQGFITDEDNISDPGADGYDSAHVMIAISVEEVLDCIMDSRVSCNMTYKRDYLFDFEDHDYGNVLLVNGEECRVRKTGNIEKADFAVKMQSGRIKVLHKAESKVEPQEDHTFEVEPQRNVAHIACSQVVQTYNLMNYHSSRERKQHSARELFRYREDNNDVAFAVAKVGKLYAQESLTFSDTVSYEVILEWKVELKEYMDARQVMYVLSNGCKSSDDSEGYYLEYTPGMFIHLFLCMDGMVFSCGCKVEIWVTKGLLDKSKGNVLSMVFIMDPSDNTLRVSQSNVYNGELVQTLLEGHFILLLEGSLSRDCDVEKNGNWEAMLQNMEALSSTGAEYITLYYTCRSCKRGYLAKGLSKELGAKLKLV
ncbi:hypothetical protein Tco_1249392, partial [Tanacetum coccineum]